MIGKDEVRNLALDLQSLLQEFPNGYKTTLFRLITMLREGEVIANESRCFNGDFNLDDEDYFAIENELINVLEASSTLFLDFSVDELNKDELPFNRYFTVRNAQPDAE